ncbi:MAG: hypothetical protein PHZ19_10525 [Candidatus Thermoplasmatota archaeon]|nr:hypothetical protein [Candidatus Thermoplasmatota archaeon]
MSEEENRLRREYIRQARDWKWEPERNQGGDTKVDCVFLRLRDDWRMMWFCISFYDAIHGGQPYPVLEVPSTSWDAFAALAPELLPWLEENLYPTPDMVEEWARALGFRNMTEREPGVLEEPPGITEKEVGR